MANERDNAETVLPLLLGRYRVEGMLGEGGLGSVYKAFDTRIKRTVAIKTLKASWTKPHHAPQIPAVTPDKISAFNAIGVPRQGKTR